MPLVWALYFVNDKLIFPKSPEDRFRVSVSPFYLKGSNEGDYATAEDIKDQIESTAGDRIEVIVLDTPPIKDKEDAIYAGKKAGAHLAVYGGEEIILGNGIQIEFRIVPIHSETVMVASTYSDKEGEIQIKASYYKLTENPIVIVESLSENVSSVIYTICAFEYYERSEYDSALKTFKCIKNYENDGSILFYIATCCLSEGELNESLEYFNRLLELNPQYSDAWNNKGVTLSELGRYEEAIEAYNKTVELNPKDSVAWYNKGTALYESSHYEEAIETYDKAIEINPQYSNAWYNKGVALSELGRYDEAMKAYDKAIEINPQFSEAWYNKGNALYKLGHYEEAIEAYNKTIEINPKSSEAWTNKGAVLAMSGNYEEAVEAFNEVIEFNPQDSDAWYGKGVVLTMSGNYEEAIKAYDKSIELNSQDPEAWYNRACVYSFMKNKDEAIFNLKRAIELNSSCKEIAKNDEAFKELWEDEDFKKLTE
ncbi:tetratricopeptide repeat protein [Methanosarcina mazei]|nr:tetratricopeptide repeat protein [Methanosarcina mazei]